VNAEDDNIVFRVGYINSFENRGFPNHSLKVKIGCPLTLQRNYGCKRKRKRAYVMIGG
jgi:hypothetical protein